MRRGLTKAQSRLFAIIRSELVAGRPTPSYDELAHAMGLRAKSSIHRLVAGLVDRGYLVHHDRRGRSVALASGADAYTVYLPPDVDARLGAHVAAWGSTPQHVIVAAVTDYLARRP